MKCSSTSEDWHGTFAILSDFGKVVMEKGIDGLEDTVSAMLLIAFAMHDLTGAMIAIVAYLMVTSLCRAYQTYWQGHDGR